MKNIALPTLDPRDLASAGWGILFPAGMDGRKSGAILEALSPLLRLRQEQAARDDERLFRQFSGEQGAWPGETPRAWLARLGQAPGPVDPTRAPYYLLIAADPDQIRFDLQAQLDVQRAVGRVWFETPAEWAAYAESVARAEKESACPPRLAFFHPTHPGDAYTAALDGQITALAERARGADSLANWELRITKGEQATRAALQSLLQPPAPGLLYLAGHALVCPSGGSFQGDLQGALVCADWQGPAANPAGVGLPVCFTALDVPAETDLRGRLVILQNSFSLGTPILDDPAAGAAPLAPHALTARLPQRLLSLADGRGALGVVGWNGRLWGYAASAQGLQENYTLAAILDRLAQGIPAGEALQLLDARYAELATDMDSTLQDLKYGAKVNPADAAGRWVGQNNARGAAFFGDPAARLSVEGPRAPVVVSGEISLISQYNVANDIDLPHALPPEQPAALIWVARLTPIPNSPRQYRVETSLAEPGGRQTRAEGVITLDTNMFLERFAPQEVGMRLFNAAFGDSRVSGAPDRAEAAARESGLPLTMRLHLGAPELHSLPWEALFNPRAGGFLFERPGWVLTRAPGETAALPLPPSTAERPRALAFVAQPANLAGYFDPAAEQALARSVLANYALSEAGARTSVDLLKGAEQVSAASLARLEEALRAGSEALYLVCHAAARRADGAPELQFERPGGRAEPVAAADLALLFSQIAPARRPRLVTLTPGSSQSVQPLVALAAMLQEAGAGAALVFQSMMDPAHREVLLRKLFRALAEGAPLGQAFAAARAALPYAAEGWKVCLYAAQADAPIWQPPAQTADQPPEAPPSPEEKPPVPELTMRLARADLNTYTLTLELDYGGPAVKAAPPPRGQAQFDFTRLRAATLEAEEYGRLLTANLFADENMRAAFNQLRAAAREGPLKLRLAIDAGANELHDLAWESLRDPAQGASLAMNETLSFARFLSSSNWRRAASHAPQSWRALAVIAAPPGLERYALPPLDIAAEVAAARAALPGVELDVLASAGGAPVTLAALLEHIYSHEANLLWLALPTVPEKTEAGLLLEDVKGGARVISAAEFTDSFLNLTRPPGLVILAGANTTSIGLRLASTGIPYILANNGAPSVETQRRFMAVFIQELLRAGQPDRAAALARLSARDRPDWWMPALLTRLRAGQAW